MQQKELIPLRIKLTLQPPNVTQSELRALYDIGLCILDLQTQYSRIAERIASRAAAGSVIDPGPYSWDERCNCAVKT